MTASRESFFGQILSADIYLVWNCLWKTRIRRNYCTNL